MIKNSKPNDCFCIIYANIVTSIFSIIIIRCFFADTQRRVGEFHVHSLCMSRSKRKIILKEIICPRKKFCFPSVAFPRHSKKLLPPLNGVDGGDLKQKRKCVRRHKMKKLVMIIAIINFIFQFTIVMLNFQVEIN
jgi:hypothetical protein